MRKKRLIVMVNMEEHKKYCQNIFNKSKNPKYKINDELDIASFMKDIFPEKAYELRELGRGMNFSLIKFEHESLNFGIPLKTTKEIIDEYRRHTSLGELMLRNRDLLYVPFVPYYKLMKLYTDDKIDFTTIYTLEHLLYQLEFRYSKISYFSKFLNEIKEIFLSLNSKKYSSAIVLTLVVIEGISREYCDLNGLEYDWRASKDTFRVTIKHSLERWRDEVLFKTIQNEKIVLPKDFYDEIFLRRIDEGIDLMQSFFEFGTDYLYKSSDNLDDINRMNLSRHDILHGRGINYMNEINAYRLISCLESLAFSIR